ncbi:MAG: hypothetical protein M0C28_03745 [Candidatus Moduliflexus flocculans]|nr:hypothetical protein [Candidatus Moduliflexus flocculans]
MKVRAKPARSSPKATSSVADPAPRRSGSRGQRRPDTTRRRRHHGSQNGQAMKSSPPRSRPIGSSGSCSGSSKSGTWSPPSIGVAVGASWTPEFEISSPQGDLEGLVLGARELPVSWKRPCPETIRQSHCAKNILADVLRRHGIGFLHLPGASAGRRR